MVLLRIKKSFKQIDFDLANLCLKLCKTFLSTVNNNNNNDNSNNNNNSKNNNDNDNSDNNNNNNNALVFNVNYRWDFFEKFETLKSR